MEECNLCGEAYHNLRVHEMSKGHNDKLWVTILFAHQSIYRVSLDGKRAFLNSLVDALRPLEMAGFSLVLLSTYA